MEQTQDLEINEARHHTPCPAPQRGHSTAAAVSYHPDLAERPSQPPASGRPPAEPATPFLHEVARTLRCDQPLPSPGLSPPPSPCESVPTLPGGQKTIAITSENSWLVHGLPNCISFQIFMATCDLVPCLACQQRSIWFGISQVALHRLQTPHRESYDGSPVCVCMCVCMYIYGSK